MKLQGEFILREITGDIIAIPVGKTASIWAVAGKIELIYHLES